MTSSPLEDELILALQALGDHESQPTQYFTHDVMREIEIYEVRVRRWRMVKRLFVGVPVVFASAGLLWWVLSFDTSPGMGLVGKSGVSYPAMYSEGRVANSVNAVLTYLEGTYGAALMALFGILTIILPIFKRYKLSATFCTLAITCFVLRSMMSTFFNDEGVQTSGPDFSGSQEEIHQPSPYSANSGEREENFPPVSSEKYGTYQESTRTLVSEQRDSTFSIDVDTASYSNMRRFIRSGSLPPAESVRLEEYINYFSFSCADDLIGKAEAPLSACYEIAPSPFESGRHLLKVTVAGKSVSLPKESGWNLVFLVDVSGSMNATNKLPLVKESLKVLLRQMHPQDRIAIVTYAGSSEIVLPSTSGESKDRIQAAIDSLSTNGGTNGSQGIETAYSIAQKNFVDGSVNRVILATDGDFNVGVVSLTDLMSLITEKRKSGISLTTLGFGEGNIRDDIMEQLADHGNGNYFYIDSYQEAVKVLEKDLTKNVTTVASDVKIQIEFNPASVASYRLLGFDNRTLRREDFTDDSKDAGELGANQTVTAIYEVTLRSSLLANTDDVKPHRYQEAQPTPVSDAGHADELALLQFSFKRPGQTTSSRVELPLATATVKNSFSASSNDFKFAVAVAHFGELLRNSKYVLDLSYSKVLQVARESNHSESSTRSEFIELVENAERLSKNR